MRPADTDPHRAEVARRMRVSLSSFDELNAELAPILLLIFRMAADELGGTDDWGVIEFGTLYDGSAEDAAIPLPDRLSMLARLIPELTVPDIPDGTALYGAAVYSPARWVQVHPLAGHPYRVHASITDPVTGADAGPLGQAMESVCTALVTAWAARSG